MIVRSILLLLMLSLPIAGYAAQYPRPGPQDRRVKTVVYNPSEVVVIRGHYGFQQMIELARDEKVESISIGDSLAWQVIPNKGGNLLFLKPVDPRAHTNLAVITDKRNYTFELLAINLGTQPFEMNYVVRFQYPEDEQNRLQAQLDASRNRIAQEVVPNRRVEAANWNLDYRVKGKAKLSPLHVFDDGSFTYFRFRDQQEVPAIFLVENDQESLLNYHLSGKYVVVERVADRFMLRSRSGSVRVTRDSEKPSPTAQRADEREVAHDLQP